MDFGVPAEHGVKIKKAKQVLRLWQRTKKAEKSEADSDANCIWRLWKGPKRFERELEKEISEGIENMQTTAFWRTARIT